MFLIFAPRSDNDSDNEVDETFLSNLLIITQTPPALRRHPGGDRTGDYTTRSKMTAELAQVINDGLFYYARDQAVEEQPVMKS